LYHRNSKVEGLSTLRDEFTYLEESKNATFKVSATSLRIVGDYDIDVSIVIENEMVDVIRIVGGGKYAFSLENGESVLASKVFEKNGILKIEDLNVHIDFDSVFGNAENLNVNDNVIDLKLISKSVKPLFSAVFQATQEPVINGLTDIFNLIVQVSHSNYSTCHFTDYEHDFRKLLGENNLSITSLSITTWSLTQ